MTRTEQIEWSKTFQRFQASRERTWRPKVEAVLKQMISDGLNEPTIHAAISHLDSNIKFDKLAAVIKNIYIDAGSVFGARAYQQIRKQTIKNVGAELEIKRLMPMGFNEQLIAEIIKYFQLHLLNEAVLPITKAIKDWLLAILIKAQEEAKSITQVVNEVEARGYPRAHAFRVVRTETVKSANAGAMIAARKSPYLMDKVWISAHDKRTRDIPKDEFSHVLIDGTTIPLDAPFRVPQRGGGVDYLDCPGDPNGEAGNIISCRCCVGFVVIKDENSIPIRR